MTDDHRRGPWRDLAPATPEQVRARAAEARAGLAEAKRARQEVERRDQPATDPEGATP